tara:strand:- start:34864 stop:35544 length:681 start_codon:yes stop_codon:yes gene_type:complete
VLLREYGLRVALGLVADRLLRRLSGNRCGLYWYRFYQQAVSDQPLAREDPNLVYRWLAQHDPVLEQMPRPAANLRARFEQDVKCLVVMKQEELIACAWFGFGRFHEDEVNCIYRMPADAVWDFDVYVVPRYRLGRTFARTWQAANALLVKEGVAQSFSRISAYNPHSIRSHQRLGAVQVGSALFLRLGALQLMCSNLGPRVSLTLGSARAPQLDFGRFVCAAVSRC